MLTHLHFQDVYHYSAGDVISLDSDGIIVYANPKAVEFLFHQKEFLGKPIADFFTAAITPGLLNQQFEINGGETSLLISSSVYTDEAGDARTYLFVRDISPLKKREHLLAYLNTAAEELAQARDTGSALEKISALIVPKFSSWFSIDLLKNGQLEELVLAHEDPGMVEWARKYREAYPTDLESQSGTARVLKTGTSLFVPVITAEMVQASIKNPAQLESVQRMNLQSLITVAIHRRDAIIGIISFVSSKTGYYFDETDLGFAKSFAGHIGMALENARLNEAAQSEIARRKQIEAQLKVTQSQLRSALSSGLVGTWILDLQLGIVYGDEHLCRMFGVPYSEKGLKQDEFTRMIHPDDRPLTDQQRSRSIVENQKYETEYRVIVDGQTYWYFARGQTEVDDSGQPAFFTGVIIDITGRKEAETALRESEELFRFLADAIPHKLWTSGPDGGVTYYNQGWFDYTGIAGLEELKVKVWDTLHPDDLKIAVTVWPKTLEKGEATTSEQRFRRYDGQYRWHLTRLSPHKDEQGRIKVWVGTSTDIHELKTIQDALETSEAHFKAITQLNSLPIWQVNAQCEMVFVNDTWRTFTGVTAEQIRETDWTDNVHPDDREEAVRQFNTAFDLRQPVHLHYRFRHAPSGEYRWMLDNALPVFDPAFQGYIGTMTDIHQQEEARLTIQQLMGKKDEFISIASHELKTPLTSIKAFNQMILRAASPEQVRHFAAKSADHLVRLEKLINDLLDVTKMNAGKMQYHFAPFSFSNMLAECIEVARHLAPEHELILENTPDITCNGDRFRLEQVVNNFLANAIKYSPGGKKIIVKSFIDQEGITVSVQDFGIGIAKENVDMLFERYYRVDESSMRFQGLGLGLFISSEILKRHNGSCWIESEPGKGSTFYFRLPYRFNRSILKLADR